MTIFITEYGSFVVIKIRIENKKKASRRWLRSTCPKKKKRRYA